ncbi:MAG: DoxX family protein [Chitinophagaceae bacterium]|nr:DoxX family protein [Chitinophagaceae bacterium]
MKLLINFVRVFVGVLFIFSGLVKANDPLGLSYKMQEFFELWNMHFLNAYTLSFSIIMIAFEIVAGVALLVGWQMRLFSWLLLILIIFFTFLTGYAVITGTPKECGCFGNCIPLTSDQSFMKDLLLLALILLLLVFRKKIQPLFSAKGSIIVLFFSTVFTLAFMWYALVHLPVVDCLAYKEGNSILGGMKVPEGARPDSTVITFVYKKGGQDMEFTADKFPEDFSDSLYTFVKRYDKVVRRGNAEPAIKDFALTNQKGEPMTETVLSGEGYKLLLFLRSDYPQGEWLTYLDMIAQTASANAIGREIVTSINLETLYKNPPPVFYKFNAVLCDATVIKTTARANPTLFLLNRDTIVKKWSYADMDAALKYISKMYPKPY